MLIVRLILFRAEIYPILLPKYLPTKVNSDVLPRPGHKQFISS